MGFPWGSQTRIMTGIWRTGVERRAWDTREHSVLQFELVCCDWRAHGKEYILGKRLGLGILSMGTWRWHGRYRWDSHQVSKDNETIGQDHCLESPPWKFPPSPTPPMTTAKTCGRVSKHITDINSVLKTALDSRHYYFSPTLSNKKIETQIHYFSKNHI